MKHFSNFIAWGNCLSACLFLISHNFPAAFFAFTTAWAWDSYLEAVEK